MDYLLQITKLLLIAAAMLSAGSEADLRRSHAERGDSAVRAAHDGRPIRNVRADSKLRADSGSRPASDVRAALGLPAALALRVDSGTAAGRGRRTAEDAGWRGRAPRAAADTSEFREERLELVRRHIAARGIDDPLVLEALRSVPRHRFVPKEFVGQAYANRPLPIGHGQTISQPYIVAYMTALIQPKPTHRVLEVGTGSGYQAAVLARIVDTVYTIEVIPELARSAQDRLTQLGYDNVQVRQADGYFGWEEHAPFDAIVVTAAAEHIPPPLIDQLKDGGRMIIPVGSPFRTQTLMLVEKQGGELSTRSLAPVRFVPFTRDN